MSELWIVPPEARGERLDRALAHHLGLARNQIQTWIRAGRVEVDGSAAKAAHLLVGGEEVVFTAVPRSGQYTVEPESGPIHVLLEEEDFVVLDKPAGLAVHPGAGRAKGTLANRLLAHYPEVESVGGPGRPGLVHRLDLDTTGAMVVARTERAYQHFVDEFANRRVEKRYLAIVYGTPEAGGQVVEAPIGRHPHRRQQMAVREEGRPARTRLQPLQQDQGVAAVEALLETGRTHQARVHLKWAGLPLVGDPLYGEARWKHCPHELQGVLRAFPRPALHAWKLSFRHPRRADTVRVEAPIPGDLEELATRCWGVLKF